MKDCEPAARPRRTPEDETLLRRAKEVLMASQGMSEEQAHRFLQKQSMDSGAKLVETARQVLEETHT